MDLEAVQELEVEVEETTPQGYSAYEVAVQNGFEGTEAEWLASLKGADGQDGATGPQGPQGQPGTNGTNGTNATVNGVSTINIVAGDNVTIEQEDGTLTINSTGGGTTDYTNLENKPSINNVTLSGNKTSSDLGLQPAGNYLTSETDPVFSASASAGITSENISSWSAKYDKPSGGIPSTDLSSAVQTSLGKADTALQSYTEQYTGTITSVKMNGSTIASSGEADLGTVITSHQDISGKQDTMQFSTMPTADATTVGKIIQYTGTTNANYTNGYFYIGINNGGTYGWMNVNVQPAPDLSNYYTKSEINRFSPMYDFLSTTTATTIPSGGLYLPANDLTALTAIVNEVYSKGQHSFGIHFSYYENMGASVLFASAPSNRLIQMKPTTYDFVATFPQNASFTQLVSLRSYLFRIEMVWNGDVATITSARIFGGAGFFLSTTNQSSYTPTGNYNPATKKYVDDSIATAIATTLGGSF